MRVHASSVNPADAAIAGGMLNGMFEHRFPVVLGRDYAGVVEQVGPGVVRYSAGDEVFGFMRHADPVVHDGTWADRIVVPEDDLDRAQAARRGLRNGGSRSAGRDHGADRRRRARPERGRHRARGRRCRRGRQLRRPARRSGRREGDRAGAARGRRVLARPRRQRRCSTATRTSPRRCASAILTASTRCSTSSPTRPDGFEANAAVLNAGGRGATPLGSAGDGPGRTNVMAVPSAENLERLGQLLEGGSLRVPIQESYELEQAGTGAQRPRRRRTRRASSRSESPDDRLLSGPSRGTRRAGRWPAG